MGTKGTGAGRQWREGRTPTVCVWAPQTGLQLNAGFFTRPLAPCLQSWPCLCRAEQGQSLRHSWEAPWAGATCRHRCSSWRAARQNGKAGWEPGVGTQQARGWRALLSRAASGVAVPRPRLLLGGWMALGAPDRRVTHGWPRCPVPCPRPTLSRPRHSWAALPWGRALSRGTGARP